MTPATTLGRSAAAFLRLLAARRVVEADRVLGPWASLMAAQDSAFLVTPADF